VAHINFEPTGEGSRDSGLETIDSPRAASEAADGTPSVPANLTGRVGSGLQLDGDACQEVEGVGGFGYFDKFSVALWVMPREWKSGTIISRMTDEDQADGWYMQLQDGRVQVNLVKRWLDDAIRIESVQSLPTESWTHVAFTYDGSRTAAGVALYFNGRPVPVAVQLDFLNQSFSVKEPLRIGGGNGPQGRFRGNIDEVTIFQRCLDKPEIMVLSTPEPVDAIARLSPDRRSPGQREKLSEAFLASAASPEAQAARERLIELRERRQAMSENLPTVMVMEEMRRPRDTFVLRRGEYDKHGERVEPGVPACLPGLPDGAENDRLGFARWLVAPGHPLTGRVAVNRIWQLHFGAGLVRTTEDFGSQGEPPTHPELLDWLAHEFTHTGWDVKSLQRLIVNSATYRQSAMASPRELAMDPDNRWLSRGPRFRLSAEMIRDQALAVSGLLVGGIGGPSVKPYQPSDLWKDLATDNKYEQDRGANLYRRSLYTYWKRTVAPPGMMTFDAASREACQVRSQRTNTPLQALTLLNDVTYVEAARVLAERVLVSAPGNDADRVELAFRLCTARRLDPAEREVLVAAVQRHRDEFRRDPGSAAQLARQGEYAADARLDAIDVAAYAALGNLLLNLDETVTR
jgi:hypothetical protein